MPWHVCGAQRITVWSSFSLPPFRGPGVKLRLLGLQRKPSPTEPSHRMCEMKLRNGALYARMFE